MTLDSEQEAKLEEAFKAWRNAWEKHADPLVGNPIPNLPELTQSLDRLEKMLSVYGKPWGYENGIVRNIHTVEAETINKLPEPESLNAEQLEALIARFHVFVALADRVGRFAAMVADMGFYSQRQVGLFPPLLDLILKTCCKIPIGDDLKESLRSLAYGLADKGEEWMAASILETIAPDEEAEFPSLSVVPLVDAYLFESPASEREPQDKPKVQELPSGKKILALDPGQQLAVLRSIWRAMEKCPLRPARRKSMREEPPTVDPAFREASRRAQELRQRLVRRNLPFGEREITELFTRWPHRSIAVAEKFVEEHGLGFHLQSALREAPDLYQIYDSPETGKPMTRIQQMLARPEEKLVIKGESPLKDTISQWLEAQDEAAKPAWGRFLRHAAATDGKSRPTDKWLEAAGEMVAEIGADRILKQLHTWAAEPGLSKIGREPAGDILKAMVWLVADRKDEGLIPFLGSLCEAAYRKVPGVGPGAVPLANACIDALSEPQGERAVAELVRLKSRIKFNQGLKKLNEALDMAADRAGLTVADLEEIALPTFGLDADGRRTEQLGEANAEVRITGSDEVTLSWFDADGKARKSVPASVKVNHADELKELRAEVKEIKGMLASVRWRLEKLYLNERSVPLEDWRARYLEHPLMANPTRRLIWNFDDVAAVPLANGMVNAEGRQFDPSAGASVSLWHPIQASADDAAAWRRRLAELDIVQPFKQAYREVYLLTDAERETRNYSNRFAAHFLYQQQLNALLRVRGWKHQAIGWDRHQRVMPQLALPNGLGLAVFGLNRVNMGVSQSGADLYVTSQRVRFENESHMPIDLEDIPPLVFSEVMRDVDLFVGVSSVGNNPNWEDVAAEGRFSDYWRSYNTAALSQTAITRRTVLQELLPKLKIAEACELDDRFLKVRGARRIYKIHIASGNILMEPNDQFLCIIPDQARVAKGGKGIRLPFEGDGVLSIILSKAFLLAADDKIADKTILSQIGR